MHALHSNIRGVIFLFLTLLLTNCGGSGSTKNSTTQSSTNSGTPSSTSTDDEFSRSTYKGLSFYYKSMPASSYTLKQLSDSTFDTLNQTDKLRVANKLLQTLFFGYPLKTLKEKIDSGTFLEDIRTGLEEDKTDKTVLENDIMDENKYLQTNYALNILTRFYASKYLDNYFLKNWVAYILTQTIMFSPAYELESTHIPNIARVYNRLVMMLGIDSGMRYISYVHMMSEDNWRRFRSPEDNGREMLEIFTLDGDDSHIPIAGKALQNWKLDRESDTLVVSLNQNRESLSLFGTTIYNGDDFYRELAKSNLFTQGVTTRLVNFFFTNTDIAKKSQIVKSIVASKPETWQDILLQIVFSEEYLLHSSRVASAEERFFSLAKKLDFKHRTNTLYKFSRALEDMHQASMKYKLGKLKRVPLDTLSFANYHKFIRDQVLLKKSYPDVKDDYEASSRQGWSESFVSNSNYTLNEEDGIASLESFIRYLFKATISRKPNSEEMAFFKNHMLQNKSESNTTKVLGYYFNLIDTRDDAQKQKLNREARKRNIAIIVLDYISRLSDTYTLGKVN